MLGLESVFRLRQISQVEEGSSLLGSGPGAGAKKETVCIYFLERFDVNIPVSGERAFPGGPVQEVSGATE